MSEIAQNELYDVGKAELHIESHTLINLETQGPYSLHGDTPHVYEYMFLTNENLTTDVTWLSVDTSKVLVPAIETKS